MSYRTKIVTALVNTISEEVNGAGLYNSDLRRRVYNKLKFWDEVDDYPTVFLTAGQETRDYLPSAFKWANLLVNIRIYVKSENPEEELEGILEDIERIIDGFGTLEYDTNKMIEDMQILTINTDEGLLAPIGVGEMTIKILYDLESN